MRATTVALALSCLALAPFALGPTASQAADKVSIAVVPTVPSASTYIAQDKGYFRDAGLDVTIEQINSLSKVIAFIATNKLQVGQGGLNAGYFNSVATGLPLVMTMDSGSTPQYHKILIRNELKDTIKKVADLKGRKIGVSSPGSTTLYEVGMVLKSGGLKLSDVDIKYVSFPQMAPALANGAIDAALEVAPFTDIATEQHLATAWIDPEDGYIKDLPMTNVAYVANTDWIKSNPDVAKRFFLAIAKANRDYCQAYHHGPNRADVVAIMVKNKVRGKPDLLAKMEWQARSPNGEFSLPSLMAMQNFFKNEDIIKQIAPREKLVDASFSADAAKDLGPFTVSNAASKLKGCR